MHKASFCTLFRTCVCGICGMVWDSVGTQAMRGKLHRTCAASLPSPRPQTVYQHSKKDCSIGPKSRSFDFSKICY
eukprot:5044420-Amphidinium_carterae.1